MNTVLDAIGGFLSARWTQKFLRSKAERSQGPRRAKARVVREVVVASKPELTEQRCRRLLAAVGEQRGVQPGGHVVEVITPPNWRSLSTVVRVEFSPLSEGTRISIAAWPGAQLFDGGESRRVAARVADMLRGDS